MDCSIIYYISYKTGYIQRSLTKKLRTMTDITVKSGYAAVSVQDLQIKFRRALAQSQLVIIIGGLHAAGENNVMSALSDYFTRAQLDVEFSKRIVNESGDDGYLVKTGEKYVLVLPDDPQSVSVMFGAQLLKNIDMSRDDGGEITEPVRQHTVVFAPEPDDNGTDRLKTRGRPSLILIIGISIAAAVCLAAGVWIWYTMNL